MTAGSITPESASAYAGYLDGKAAPPARGDYYLGRDGLPSEAPGRWRAPAALLERLGVDPSQPVSREALEALMEGRSPSSTRAEPEWLRRAGGNAQRAAGIDVTFSAPKSVSIAWALGDLEARASIEEAHHAAVGEALEYLRESVPMIARNHGGGRGPDLLQAGGLLAAEFLHSTARGVDGGVPDPQIHSHVVITSATRPDGSIAAIRSRPVFAAAREIGAFYRASLAWELRERGYEIESGTGKKGRYFELAGVDERTRTAFSKRAVEVSAAADEFRARTGRSPARGELRALKLATRQAKSPTTREELNQAWRQTARASGLRPSQLKIDATPKPVQVDTQARSQWAREVELGLTSDRAIFTPRELRSDGLERAAGRLPAAEAVRSTASLGREGAVLTLEDGRMTTRRMREMELDVESRVDRMARASHRTVTDRDRARGAALVQERLGGPMSAEQLHALEVLTGPERAAVLIGPAGTGKGVVIDALVHAEQQAGRTVYGTAVAGATAERLGRDSPALQGRTRNIDALLLTIGSKNLTLDRDTTIVLDEAGMGDTDRLQRLISTVDQAGAKIVLVGDSRQLASIGPGGLLERVGARAPSIELEQVRRTQDVAEQKAWKLLRTGEPEQAMAHYYARGQLHLEQTRDEALEGAVCRYDELAQRHGHREVALMTDGPNLEIDLMNRRAQQLRLDRGELAQALPHPDRPRPQFYAGDRVAWTQPQHLDGQPRVENGTRGTLVAVAGAVGHVQLDGTDRVVPVLPEQQNGLRLAYAQHLYRQQGATVDRAVTLTGGWQTSREGAYVQASRARDGVDWHVAREQLGQEGTDPVQLDRLSALMRISGAQIPSTELELADPDPVDLGSHWRGFDVTFDRRQSLAASRELDVHERGR